MLSAGLAFESAVPSQGAYDQATGLWTVGSIANAGSAGLTITARVTQAGTISNTASVTASDQPDPDPTDNTSTVTLTTATIADLAITKTLTGAAVPGLRDDLHDRGDQPRSQSGDRRERDRRVSACARCAGVDLRRRRRIELRRCLGHGQPRDHRHARGRRSRHVPRDRPDRVRARPACSSTRRPSRRRPGPSMAITANNTATSSVPLAPSAALQITKAGPANAVAGTNIVYTITVTNAGPSDATGVTLTDPTPPGLTFVVERRGLHDGLPVRPRHVAARRDPHDHGDLRDPVRLYDAQSDRQHRDGVEPDAAGGQHERDHQHAGRRAGDRSPHHEDQRGRRRDRRAADDLHHHRHQPARAERREWRDGHRHVPGDADRRDVDLCRHRGRHLRRRRAAATSTRP